jgi:bifunctional DNA-binding transcriptional regulator/antitoxin component of YhaV-PrlF toxin-antitoxin module
MTEVFKARIQKQFNVKIPPVVREILGLEEGEVVEVTIQKLG